MLVCCICPDVLRETNEGLHYMRNVTASPGNGPEAPGCFRGIEFVVQHAIGRRRFFDDEIADESCAQPAGGQVISGGELFNEKTYLRREAGSFADSKGPLAQIVAFRQDQKR